MAQGFLEVGILVLLLAYVERLYLRFGFCGRALSFAWPCFYLAMLEIAAPNAPKFDGFTHIFFSSWLLVVLAAIFLGDGLAKYVASRLSDRARATVSDGLFRRSQF